MKESNTQNYEDLIGKHQKFKEIKELSTAVDFEFASTNGDTLKEKSIILANTLNQFQFDYVVGGPETLALLEIGNSTAKIEKDVLFPINELLLVGSDPKLIKIKI
jgi:hypothetical protein